MPKGATNQSEWWVLCFPYTNRCLLPSHCWLSSRWPSFQEMEEVSHVTFGTHSAAQSNWKDLLWFCSPNIQAAKRQKESWENFLLISGFLLGPKRRSLGRENCVSSPSSLLWTQNSLLSSLVPYAFLVPHLEGRRKEWIESGEGPVSRTCWKGTEMQDSNGIMQCAPQLNSQTPEMKRNIASPSTATEGLREIRSPWS